MKGTCMKSDMSFSELVKSRFEFLKSDFGFELSRENSSGDVGYVEYRSPLVYVRLLLSGPDYEPKLVFGRYVAGRDPTDESFDWTDLGQLECCKSWKWQTLSDEVYAGRVTQLARLLRDCGRQCLIGDEAVYTQMRERRKELQQRHINEEICFQVRAKSQVAWDEQRYTDYLDHLRGISTNLSVTDQKRIEYAEKKAEKQKR